MSRKNSHRAFSPRLRLLNFFVFFFFAAVVRVPISYWVSLVNYIELSHCNDFHRVSFVVVVVEELLGVFFRNLCWIFFNSFFCRTPRWSHRSPTFLESVRISYAAIAAAERRHVIGNRWRAIIDSIDRSTSLKNIPSRVGTFRCPPFRLPRNEAELY